MAQENSEIQKEPKPGKLPLFLSTLIMPGVGQFAQRRWVVASLYVFCFWASIVPMLLAIAAFFTFYYEDLLNPEWRGYVEHGKLSWMVFRILIFGVCAFMVYLLNVIDIVTAHRRRSLAWLKRTHLGE
jgi:hypothetical protein